MSEYFKATTEKDEVMYGNPETYTVAVVDGDDINYLNYGEREWCLWVAKNNPTKIDATNVSDIF